MLAKHSITYFLGRGLPGIINFLALSIYTRLVLPAEYGSYALVITTVNLFNAVFFQWIRLVLLRYRAACTTESDKARLNTTVVVGYVASSVLAIAVLNVTLLLTDQAIPGEYVLVGIGLLLVMAFFEIGLDYYRSNLQPKQYALAHFLKAMLAILLGSGLAYAGFGAYGLLTGVLAATAAAMVLYFRGFVQDLYAGFRSIDWTLIRKHLRYGVPLTASSALTFVMDSSDRYLVNYYLGSASTGAYAVGYDLSKQTLWVIMSSISLASYPLVIRALEQEGSAAANQYLKSNLVLLVTIALPAAVMLAVLAPEVSHLLIGEKYADTVATLIPYVAVGAFLSGLKSFYIDQSFQLAHKTRLQLWSVGAAALLNVGLNVLLLPKVGLMGAAYSTLLCYAIVLVVSYVLSQRAYRLPIPWPDLGKILAATLVLGTLLLFGRAYVAGVWSLSLLGLSGVLVYGGLLVVFNVAGIHQLVQRAKVLLKFRKKVRNYA